MLDVIIVGADPLARSGLNAALADCPDVYVSGEAATAQELAMLIRETAPAALLWDGINDDTEVPTLALVTDERSAGLALANGADGVLFRDGDPSRIAAALTAITQHIRVIDAAFTTALLPASAAHGALDDELTARELEVLGLLAEGLSNRLIARRLEFSEHTAKFHVNAILFKLSARSRTDAVVRGIRLGLLRV